MLILVSALLALLAVGVHYEALVVTTRVVRRIAFARRSRVAAGVALAVGAHVLEIIVFGLGWAALIAMGLTQISVPSPTFGDILYFSGTTYTSLGYGDIVPVGNGRILAVVETVTGLVLIAWTASFTFFEMSENWDTVHREPEH